MTERLLLHVFEGLLLLIWSIYDDEFKWDLLFDKNNGSSSSCGRANSSVQLENHGYHQFNGVKSCTRQGNSLGSLTLGDLPSKWVFQLLKAPVLICDMYGRP